LKIASYGVGFITAAAAGAKKASDESGLTDTVKKGGSFIA